jgi:hypothetical protein
MGKLLDLISDKPHIGFASAGGGAIAGLLTWLHVVTPLLGGIAALFGAIAGFFTMVVKYREWKKGRWL